MLLALFGIGGWEVILILAIVLIVFCARKLPELFKGLSQGLDDFWNAMDEISASFNQRLGTFKRAVQGVLDELTHDPKFHHPDYRGEPRTDETRYRGAFAVWVAQGFGIGRIPLAPGTFGSFAALLWFALLISTGSFLAYLFGAIEGVAFSIWLCDEAEKILQKEDPGSVVLDEIAAIPFCFLPWVTLEWCRHGALPPVADFFTGPALRATLGIVVLFRVFDIWKPWPVRQSQNLAGGWGVTVDDLLAALYVALISLTFVVGLVR
jgi:phosphatidylglycerophosphatase A